ncbi:hypothetical protein ABIB48_002078 [Arthrobacter sp. UYCu511]
MGTPSKQAALLVKSLKDRLSGPASVNFYELGSEAVAGPKYPADAATTEVPQRIVAAFWGVTVNGAFASIYAGSPAATTPTASHPYWHSTCRWG